jgi:hypothetical protein
LHEQLHPMTPHHLPFYFAKPGETDVLMIVMGIFLIVALLGGGNLYLHLHSQPKRMAHKSPQFEIVAVLGLEPRRFVNRCRQSVRWRRRPGS